MTQSSIHNLFITRLCTPTHTYITHHYLLLHLNINIETMRGAIPKSYFKMLLLVCGVLFLNVTQTLQSHTSTPHHAHYKYIHYYNTSDFFFWLLKKRRQKRPVSTQMRRAEAGLFWLLKKRRQKWPISTQKRRTEEGLEFWLWRKEADLSHKFLGGEDQFVVDKPARVFLEETGVGVHHHRLLMLHCLVLPAFPQPRRVVEIARRDRLVTAYNQNVLPLMTHTIKMYCFWWLQATKLYCLWWLRAIKLYCLCWLYATKLYCLCWLHATKLYWLWWHLATKMYSSGDTMQSKCIASCARSVQTACNKTPGFLQVQDRIYSVWRISDIPDKSSFLRFILLFLGHAQQNTRTHRVFWETFKNNQWLVTECVHHFWDLHVFSMCLFCPVLISAILMCSLRGSVVTLWHSFTEYFRFTSCPFLTVPLQHTLFVCVCVCVCVRAYTCVCVYVHVYVCASVIACMSVFNVHAAHRIFFSYFSLSCIWGCVDPLRIFFFFKGERQTMTKTDRQWERQRERVHEKEMDRHRQQEQRRWWCVEVT